MHKISLAEAFHGLAPEARFALYRELWVKTGSHQLLTDFPLHLDLELSAVCNLRCRHCFQNGLLEGPLGFMPVELFEKIIDEGVPRGLCAVKLQVRGESLLHPSFFDCAAYAKRRGVMDLQLTTNALVLDEHNIGHLFECGLDGLIVSYDRHHGDALNRDYRVVEENIRRVLNHRSRLGTARPWVRIQGSTFDEDRDQIAAELRQRFPEVERIDVNKIHTFDYGKDCYPGLTENNELLPCNYPMQRLAVYWDGGVTACCMDYNNRFDFGNATSQSIFEIWNSPRVEEFRARHLDGQRSEVEVCNRCLVAIRPKQKEV